MKHGEIKQPTAAELAGVLTRFVQVVKGFKPEDVRDLAELLNELREAESIGERDRSRAAIEAIGELFAGDRSWYRPTAAGIRGSRPEKLSAWIHHVATRVRRLRKERRMTQHALAERSGIRQSHLSRIEQGRLSASRKTIERIASGLGVPLGELDPSAD